jgi:hypothetical protein
MIIIAIVSVDLQKAGSDTYYHNDLLEEEEYSLALDIWLDKRGFFKASSILWSNIQIIKSITKIRLKPIFS